MMKPSITLPITIFATLLFLLVVIILYTSPVELINGLLVQKMANGVFFLLLSGFTLTGMTAARFLLALSMIGLGVSSILSEQSAFFPLNHILSLPYGGETIVTVCGVAVALISPNTTYTTQKRQIKAFYLTASFAFFSLCLAVFLTTPMHEWVTRAFPPAYWGTWAGIAFLWAKKYVPKENSFTTGEFFSWSAIAFFCWAAGEMLLEAFWDYGFINNPQRRLLIVSADIFSVFFNLLVAWIIYSGILNHPQADHSITVRTSLKAKETLPQATALFSRIILVSYVVLALIQFGATFFNQNGSFAFYGHFAHCTLSLVLLFFYWEGYRSARFCAALLLLAAGGLTFAVQLISKEYSHGWLYLPTGLLWTLTGISLVLAKGKPIESPSNKGSPFHPPPSLKIQKNENKTESASSGSQLWMRRGRQRPSEKAHTPPSASWPNRAKWRSVRGEPRLRRGI